jgi:hypothetical protein
VLPGDGHGDHFLFLRYAEHLRTRARKVTFALTRPVYPLAKHSLPHANVVPVSACASALSAADAYIHCWPLPGLCGGFGEPQWVRAPRSRAKQWRLPAGFHVGVVWRGGTQNLYDGTRSVTPEALAPVFEIPGVQWHSLQVTGTCPARVANHAGKLRDFADTAALVSCLDLVVTVDSAVANLCGAMGRPVWVLVEDDPDFRWCDSRWFPSGRVFRQDGSGWAPPVIERVCDALRLRIAS